MRFTLTLKTWMLLGTLVALTALGGLAVAQRIDTVDQAVRVVTEDAFIRQDLADQVEINLAEVGVSSLAYVERTRPLLRSQAAEDIAALNRSVEELSMRMTVGDLPSLTARFSHVAHQVLKVAEQRRSLDQRLTVSFDRAAEAFETRIEGPSSKEALEAAAALADVRGNLAAYRGVGESERLRVITSRLADLETHAAGLGESAVADEVARNVESMITLEGRSRSLVGDLVTLGDQIDTRLEDEIQASIAREVEQASDAAASAVADTRTIQSVTVLILVATGLVALVAIRVTVVHRIRRLAEATRLLGEGHPTATVEVRGTDEVAELGAAFKWMVRTQAEAERALVESHRRLEEQTRGLRVLDEFKDQFVASVSHDLRTPLTPIVAYAELLLDEEAGPLTDEQRGFIEVMVRSADRLRRMVDDLLLLGRLDAGRVTFHRAPVDVAAVARAVVAHAEVSAARQGVSLSVEAHQSAWCEGDASGLTRVVDNLVGNAIKFTRSGGSVIVRVGQAGDLVAIEVEDTGVGIPGDQQDLVFDRFFRGPNGNGVQGSGIGLAIVKAVTEAHQGRVHVDSVAGRGTTFRVELPVGAPAIPMEEVPA